MKWLKQIFELYKNPQTLANFKPYARGIITTSGDLYVVDYDFEVENKNHEVFIHSDIVQWLNEIGALYNCRYEEGSDPADYLDEFLSVERKAATNEFIIAESYPEDFANDPFFEKYIEKWSKIWNKKQKRFLLSFSFS